MIKHTPGPWEAVITSKLIEVQHPGEGPPVVEWAGFDTADRPTEVHHANARLIAAAPDLLAACMAAKRYVAMCNANKITTTEEGRKKAGEAFEAVVAAIAKAEGK